MKLMTLNKSTCQSIYGTDMRYAMNSTVPEGSHFGVVDAFEQKEVLEFSVTYKELVAKEVSSFR